MDANLILENQLESAKKRFGTMLQTARQLPLWQRNLMEPTLSDISLTVDSLLAMAQELRGREQALVESTLALEAEKQRQRKLFDLSPNGLLITSSEGLIWEANATASRLLSAAQDTLPGKTLFDFIDPREQVAFRARLAQVQSGKLGQFSDWPIRLRPAQTGVEWVALDLSTINDQRGELVGLRWLLRDVSLQRQMDDALRKSEERYRRLLSSVTDYVYTVEIKNNRPISTSHGPGCVAVTGYTAEEYAVDPQLWLRMVYKEDQKSVLRQARRALNGDSQPLEHRIIHKNGGIRWVRNTPVPRYDDQGRLTSYDGLITDITERVEAEEAMRRTNQRFQELVQSLDGIVWEVDLPAFNFIYVSPQAERILGYPAQQWLENPAFWQEHIVSEDRDWAINFCKTQTVAKQDHSFEYRMLAADGRIVWLKDVVTVVIEQDQPVKLRGVMVDITQQKDGEQELRESEEKYRTLFDASTDAIFVETLDNRIMDCNVSTTQIYGYSKEEMLHLVVHDLIPAEIKQALPDINDQIIQEGHVFLEAQNVRKDGEVFPCEVNIVATQLGGQPRVITYVRDVTKRKKAELELQKTQAELEMRVRDRTAQLQIMVDKLEHQIEERQRAEQALEQTWRFLQSILDCLPTPVFYKDTQGRFLGCNQAFEKYIGFPRDAIIDHTVDDLAPEDLAAESTAADQALFSELEEQEYESLIMDAQGVRHNVILTKAPFFNQDGSLGGLVGSIFDLTERKRMEAYMMRTERLAAMGSIAATLAHEIKNPLQTIQSNIELVLDFDLDPEEQDQYLQLCYREIERLIEITTRLLDLALPRRGPNQPASIPDLIQHTLALVEHPLEQAHVQVITEIAPDLPSEPMPERIIEVLLNLIINAIEAIPLGGTINIYAWTEEGRIRIAVKNSGEPIPLEHLEHIFEPFFTTKPTGSGLGLPISHSIVEQLGGSLDVENLQDGVQFTISLPISVNSSLTSDSAEIDPEETSQ